MSEFTDQYGRILTGRARRFATHLDGMSRRELRRIERFETRSVVCRLCGRTGHPDEMREGLCPNCDRETR